MMRVMLVPNGLYASAVDDARRLAGWLDEEGVDVVYAPSFELGGQPDLEGLDLVVSLGGDGTLLRAAHLVGYSEIPILGLSYGHLGFLTYDDAGGDVCAAVGAALAGELHPSRRATLEVALYGTDGAGNEEERRAFALNEVVLARGGSGKMVEFDVRANGCFIDHLRGDGFVVATATGSTGYALSAGGPIVTPSFSGLVCVPVAPHTITARAFLTSPSDVVELAVSDERSSDRCVFADGEPLAPDLLVDRLEVVRGPGDVVLLTGDSDDFYGSVSRVFYGKVH